ncbi:MAG: YbhB/YbcL family Raf kinase inhibitor-like protein [Actinobacteria bacterium]|nr:MAG: YbhB/YbcL family Raf kinase inhibitor-like protein [Actinomycetota bacterium]
MRISSPEFEHEGTLPSRYTCDGEGMSPPLVIEDVPVTAESLVLISDDPDAVSGTFVHWTVWNVDPHARHIEEDSVPPGALEGANSASNTGYHPPCPPTGSHRYFFKLYALDTSLDLPAGAGISDLESAMEGHMIDKSEIYARYRRV